MTDYTPLHGGDPFPADWRAVEAYGRDVSATGELIAESVALLRRCADENNWETETADAFRERAEDLADDIDKTRGRYEEVGARLVAVSDSFDTAETQARWHAFMARQEEAAAGSSEQEPGRGDDGSVVPLTPGQEQANSQREAAVDEIARLQRLFDDEVANAREAADAAASAIKGVLDDDVKDGWWDRNAGWLKVVTQVLSVIIAVAAIVLLTVATGGTIWLVALAVSVAAGLMSLAINVGLARSGNGSWWNVAFDVVGLLTLGAGGKIASSLARALPSLRAGTAPLAATNGFVRSFRGLRVGIGNTLLRLPARMPFQSLRAFGSTRIANAAHRAFGAAAAARARVLVPPEVSRLSRLVHGGGSTAADFANARTILSELRQVSRLPDALAPGAAGLLDDAVRVRNLYVGGLATGFTATANGIARTTFDITNGDGIDMGGVSQVVIDLIARGR